MWTFIHKAGSPKTSYQYAAKAAPWIMSLSFIACIYGLTAGLAFAPSDYQQGNVYRIIYCHVPSAILSLMIYITMSISVIIFFIWKIKVADVVAKASAPIGAWFALLTLVTGSIWGKPTWGTWWIWDARLTSELILLFIYCGIIAIRSAIPDFYLGAKASGLITLIGLVNIPIVHFSVDWWNTLHQGASISFFGKSQIAPSMLHPLIAMIIAFVLYYVGLVLIKIRYELLVREKNTSWVKQIVLEGKNK